MKKYYSIVFGLTSIFWIQTAHADTCEIDILDEMRPISTHYTQRVLDRAEQGISNAEVPAGIFENTIFEDYYRWISSISKVGLAAVDTNLRIVTEEERLDRTACFHIDLMLIEAQMQRVLCKLREGFDQGSIAKVTKLKILFAFLNDRYKDLFYGGTDPFYEDVNWQRKYYFDEPNQTWCCTAVNSECVAMPALECWFQPGIPFDTIEGCIDIGCTDPHSASSSSNSSETGDENLVCPFHSNYLPPTAAGFGCGADVLEAYDSGSSSAPHQPTQDEVEAAKATVKTRKELIDGTLQSIIDVIQAIDPTFSATVTDFPEGGILDKQEVWGCEGRTSFQTNSAGSATSVLYDTSDVAPGFLYEKGASRWETRGPFSFEKKQEEIIQRLYETRLEWGARRPFPSDLQYEGEWKDDSPFPFTGSTLFTEAFKADDRLKYRKYSIEQLGREAEGVTSGVDTVQQMRQYFGTPLRYAVADFSSMARNLGSGTRGFARDFAFYLRRSCIYRPCNEHLERMLKILFEDDCFPYVSGRFFNVSGSRMLHENCMDAAES